MSRCVVIHCLINILLQQLISPANADDPRNILTTTVVQENGIEIHLKLIKTKPYLANKHLPVWSTKMERIVEREKNIMERVGRFETYHDVENSAAAVYFVKSKCLYGVIDRTYRIICLPLDKLNLKHVIGRNEYIVKYQLNDATNDNDPYTNSCFDNQPLPVEVPSKRGSSHLPLKKRPYARENTHSFDDDDEALYTSCVSLDKRRRSSDEINIALGLRRSSGSRDEPDIPFDLRQPSTSREEPADLRPNYYPKILLLISYDIVKLHKDIFGNNYMKHLVMHNIVYMNAVAMLFAKLEKTAKIYLNIAGIIVEDTQKTFQFMSDITSYVNGQPNTINRSRMTAINQYINVVKDDEMKELFFVDSFDYFLLLTNFRYETVQEDEQLHRGISLKWFSYYEARGTTNYRMNTVYQYYLGSIVDNSDLSQSYVDTAHEIAHLFQVADDPSPSHFIMQKYQTPTSENTLQWSEMSVKDFNLFFSKNRDRCFLRAIPRSLYPYNNPIRTLSPIEQCQCYGFGVNPEEKNYLDRNRGKNVCKRVIPCHRTEAEMMRNPKSLKGTVSLLPFPIDGTPCSDDTMVCWQRHCVDIKKS